MLGQAVLSNISDRPQRAYRGHDRDTMFTGGVGIHSGLLMVFTNTDIFIGTDPKCRLYH